VIPVSRPSSVALAAVALLVAACAPMPPAVVYAPQQAMRAQTVELGFVEAMRDVRIGGARTGVGGASGAMVGSIAGSYAGGSWQANVAGSIVGAILGAMIGSAVEESATSRPGVEVSVRLDNGGLVVVVQDAELDALRPGERVRVITDGPSARVTR
jgi:outer membrane lipoprotein SlyB